jgi:multidrug resistance efflux pump
VNDVTEFAAKVTTLEAALSAKETALTALTEKLAAADSEILTLRAKVTAADEAHARLAELHAAAKRSLGVMPAAVLPEVSITATEKTAADYRAEFAAIKDPSARAAYFAANQNNLFGN